MVIPLTPDIETALIHEAQRQGTTPEQLAIDSLGKLFLLPGPAGESIYKGSLADFLAGHIGTVNGTTEALSENCGRLFADAVLEKQRQGRL
jgi:hypothetical protein